MAVTGLELVFMPPFSLWVFTAVLTIFQLIILLREHVQSVFFLRLLSQCSEAPCCFLAWGSLYDWLVYCEKDCLSGTSPCVATNILLWEIQPAFSCKSTHAINTCNLISLLLTFESNGKTVHDDENLKDQCLDLWWSKMECNIHKYLLITV